MARGNGNGGVGGHGPSTEERSAQLARFGPVGTMFTVHFKSVDLHLTRMIAPAWTRGKLRTGTTAALAMIVSQPGVSQNEVAQAMLLDKSGVTQIVDTLERLGWAERRPAPDDKRRNALYASPTGEAVFAGILTEMRGIEAKMLAGLSETERDQLVDLLDKLHASMVAANMPQ